MAASDRTEDIQLVLVGMRGSGRDICGNIILGSDLFQSADTVNNEKHTKNIEGRWVTVINTPDLDDDSSADYSPYEYSKMAGERPSVFLLVLKDDSRDEEKKLKKVIERKFGKRAKRHLIILHGDHLTDDLKSAKPKQKAKRNKHLVFNKSDTTNNRQVAELLESAENLLQRRRMPQKTQLEQYRREENKCTILDTQSASMRYKLHRVCGSMSATKDKYTEPEGQRRMPNSVAVESKMAVSVMGTVMEDEGVNSFRHQKGKNNTTEEGMVDVKLVLLGRRGSGKSCCGNTILDSKAFQSHLSTTPVTTECEEQSTTLHAKKVTVIDTPDFFGDSLPDPGRHIKKCISMVGQGPSAFLLVLQLGRFTEGEKKIVAQVKQAFGSKTTKNMIVLFSYGDDLEDVTIEEFLRNAHPDLKALVKKCGNRYHVFNNRDTSGEKQVMELLEKVNLMLKGHRKFSRVMEMW